MNRDKAIKAIAAALPERKGGDRDREAADAFDALVKAHMPKTAFQNELNGTWWQKTAAGQKLINTINVKIV